MLLQELAQILYEKSSSALIQPGNFMLWTDTADFSNEHYKSPTEMFGEKVKHISFDKSKMKAAKAEVLRACTKYDADFSLDDLDYEIDILGSKPSAGGHYEIYDVSALSKEEITVMKRQYNKAKNGDGSSGDPDNWSSVLINLPKGLTVDGLAKLAVRRWGNPAGSAFDKSTHTFEAATEQYDSSAAFDEDMEVLQNHLTAALKIAKSANFKRHMKDTDSNFNTSTIEMGRRAEDKLDLAIDAYDKFYEEMERAA